MQFQVQKKKFVDGRLVESKKITEDKLSEDDILVKLDKFAYTSNNITYAVAGDMIGYWNFFPAQGEDPDGWGVIPVWGFAEVVISKHQDVKVGERLFGYFPPASHLLIKATNVGRRRIIDGAAHRASLPAPYNAYRRVEAEPNYNQAMDDVQMLLLPLHLTSFCLWDALVDADWYQAKQVIILSASSKTSLGLAYALKRDENAPKIVGLTSGRNKEKVIAMDMYDSVLTYDDIDSLDKDAAVIVDMSGNLQVLNQINDLLADDLKYCINVGLTHWKDGGQVTGPLAKKSSFFFAPGHMQKRTKEWGREEFDKKSNSFLFASLANSKNWLTVEKVNGLDGLLSIHEDVCLGKIEANKGIVVQL